MEPGTLVTKQPLVDKESKAFESDENLPIGLRRLSTAKNVTITQLIDPVEVLLCCFARPCRYSVYVENDSEHSLYIQEVSDCYARQIMGAARSFALKVTDTDGFDDIRLVRPQTCSRGCCGICCVLPSLEVQSPPGQTVAVITDRNGDLAARLCKQTKYRASECTGAANDIIIKCMI